EELSVRLERQRDLNERSFPRRMPQETERKPQPPAVPTNNNQMGSLMSFVIGFVIVLGAIVAAAVAISKWVSVTAAVMTSIVIIGALLAMGVAGAMDLRNRGILSEENFLKLMIESYKRLPLLRGKR